MLFHKKYRSSGYIGQVIKMSDIINNLTQPTPPTTNQTKSLKPTQQSPANLKQRFERANQDNMFSEDLEGRIKIRDLVDGCSEPILQLSKRWGFGGFSDYKVDKKGIYLPWVASATIAPFEERIRKTLYLDEGDKSLIKTIKYGPMDISPLEKVIESFYSEIENVVVVEKGVMGTTIMGLQGKGVRYGLDITPLLLRSGDNYREVIDDVMIYGYCSNLGITRLKLDLNSLCYLTSKIINVKWLEGVNEVYIDLNNDIDESILYSKAQPFQTDTLIIDIGEVCNLGDKVLIRIAEVIKGIQTNKVIVLANIGYMFNIDNDSIRVLKILRNIVIPNLPVYGKIKANRDIILESYSKFENYAVDVGKIDINCKGLILSGGEVINYSAVGRNIYTLTIKIINNIFKLNVTNVKQLYNITDIYNNMSDLATYIDHSVNITFMSKYDYPNYRAIL